MSFTPEDMMNPGGRPPVPSVEDKLRAEVERLNTDLADSNSLLLEVRRLLQRLHLSDTERITFSEFRLGVQTILRLTNNKFAYVEVERKGGEG